jgi:hypothetical protein
MGKKVRQGNLGTLPNGNSLLKARSAIEQVNLAPRYESHEEGRRTYHLSQRAEIEYR